MKKTLIKVTSVFMAAFLAIMCVPAKAYALTYIKISSDASSYTIEDGDTHDIFEITSTENRGVYKDAQGIHIVGLSTDYRYNVFTSIYELSANSYVNHTENGMGVINNSYGTVSNNYGAVLNNYGTVECNQNTGGVSNNNGTISTNHGLININNSSVSFNDATIATNSSTGHVESNQVGSTVGYNAGLIDSNRGVVSTNAGVVSENNNRVSTNNGTVESNNNGATVTTNNGCITTNKGGSTVTTNNGRIENNNGTVTTNSSTGVININFTAPYCSTAIVATNNGRIEDNQSTVAANGETGIIAKNSASATVTTNDGHVYQNENPAYEDMEGFTADPEPQPAPELVIEYVDPESIKYIKVLQDKMDEIKDVAKKLESGELKGPQTVSYEGNNVPMSMLFALENCPNITLEYTTIYDNKNYRFLIPGGKKSPLDPSFSHHGPLGLNVYYRNLAE